MNSNQLMLKQFIDSHHFESQIQDNGVIVFIPVYRGIAEYVGNEAHYCETARQTRTALGY